MGFLESKGIGTNAACRSIPDAAYVAYFAETGMDMYTGKEPKHSDREWALSEINKIAESKRAYNNWKACSSVFQELTLTIRPALNRGQKFRSRGKR